MSKDNGRPNRIMAPVPWYGGKGQLAKKIIPYIPEPSETSKVYVEPFCGAASVFWHLPHPYPVEVLNDLDERLVNLFRCLQDKSFYELAHKIKWTLYSHSEFKKAIRESQFSDDDVERAWALYVMMNQGFAGIATADGNWGRVFVSVGGMAGTTNKWINRQNLLEEWRARLMRCQISCQGAVDCIKYWDSPSTVFYCDPPYVHSSRTSKNNYHTEMTDSDHERLVAALIEAEGQVVLSGYNHEIYDPLMGAGWEKKEFETACYAAARVRGSKLRGKGSAMEHVARTEVLWLKLRRQERTLF